MSLKRQALRNVSSNWFGLGVSMVVGFFLAPFILHRLGDDAFGLWTLVLAVSGYYGLFELGIRSSIVKYVAHYKATKDEDGLSRVINTTLFTYTCIAAVLLIVTLGLYRYVDTIFRVSAPLQHSAPLLFLMVGVATAIGFPLGVFGGLLEGLQRFDWLNLAQSGGTIVRALLIVLALERGGGLLTLGFITVLVPLLVSAVFILVVRRLNPFELHRRFVNRESFRMLMGYGAVTFVVIVAEQLRFQSDAAVIGVFLSASAITYFAIAAKLADYAVAPVNNLAIIFLPMSSQFDATRQPAQLRRIFVEGNRLCGFIMFPICAALVILGKPLITVWVGAKYTSSYIVLLLLLLPKTLYRSQAASNRILFGMARHRALAVVVIVEGIANLVLSIILVRPYGIVGDALGTTIPLTLTSLFFLPIYLCRLLKVPLRTFLYRAYLAPLLLSAPLVGVLLLMQLWFRPATYFQLVVQLAAAGSVYGAGLLWMFLTHEPAGVRMRQGLLARLKQARG
jgi:O-antigen/teichoic acid export membrane protein